jgi:hypothetical protein
MACIIPPFCHRATSQENKIRNRRDLFMADFQGKVSPPHDEGEDRTEACKPTARVKDALAADEGKSVFHKSGTGKALQDLCEVIGMDLPFLHNDLDEAAAPFRTATLCVKERSGPPACFHSIDPTVREW